MVELPSWHSKGGGFSGTALGHRPKNRHSSKANRVSALVSCLFPVLACLCRGFPGSGSLVSPALPLRVPLCFCSASCFFLLAAGVTFQLPAGGTSGQAQGHRPKNRYRAPTQGPAFTGTPLCTTFLRTSLCLNCSFPCTLLFIFRVCFGHCSGYLRHRQLRAQWYKTSPQVLKSSQDFCRSPGEAQAALDGGRRSRWSLLSLSQGTEQRVFHWLSLTKHL